MLNFFANLNFTDIIAILGLLLSVLNLFKSYWDNRSNLKMTYKSCTICKKFNPQLIYFELSFINCSKLQISISRIFLHVNNEIFEFSWVPEYIFDSKISQNEKTLSTYHQLSERIPHTIDGLGIWGGFFAFRESKECIIDDFHNAEMTIVAYTNRGIKKFPITVTKSIT